ncbi:hypothetical protein BH10BDE1_BH10BDE1_32330 [soil metagenome]
MFLVLLVISMNVFGSPAEAQATPQIRSCETLFAASGVPLLAGSKAQLAEQVFANWVDNYEDGLANRGFMGNAIPNTPETSEIAMKHGLIWWGGGFRLVPTLEAAIAHRAQVRGLHEQKKTLFTDRIVAGLYVLGSESELGVKFDADTSSAGSREQVVAAEKIEELLSRGAYEIDENGQVTRVSAEHLLRRYSAGDFKYMNVSHLPQSAGLNSIVQSGWVVFKLHGLHDYSTWKSSGSAKKLKKLAVKLMEMGFTIRFNYDHKAAIDMLATQDRTYVEAVKDGKPGEVVRTVMGNHMNRYSQKEVYDPALARLLAGKGYSIGVYNEANELVGGEIGFRNGNHILGESVFYDRRYNFKEHGFDGVDLAKVAAVALMEILLENGQPYSDPGMITAYTASMGAELVEFREFREKILSRQGQGPNDRIEFPETWDPRPANHLELAFTSLKDRRGQMITANQVVGRTPAVSEKSLSVGSSMGFERTQLRVVVVNSVAEAQNHARELSNGGNVNISDVPLYLIVEPQKVAELMSQGSNDPNLMFKNWVEGAAGAVWFKNLNHLEHVQSVRPDHLRAMLGADSALNPVLLGLTPGSSSTNTDSLIRDFVVPAWRIR